MLVVEWQGRVGNSQLAHVVNSVEDIREYVSFDKRLSRVCEIIVYKKWNMCCAQEDTTRTDTKWELRTI